MSEGLRVATRIALVVSVASVAAGCSSMSRFSETPLFAGSSAKSATTPIESADLGPVGATPTAYAAVSTSSSLKSRGWSVEGAPIVEVSQNDTAATLSAGFGVPVSVILEANGLTSAGEVRPGQRLVIPTYVRVDNPVREPIAVANDVAAAPPVPVAQGPLKPGESRHIVQAGDNLDRLAGAYRVPATEIAAANGLPAGAPLAEGTALRIPASLSPATVAAAPMPAQTLAPPVLAVATATPPPVAGMLAPPEGPLAPPAGPMLAAPTPAVPAAATMQVASIAPKTATDAAPEPANPDNGSGFRWPVRGKILTGFGKTADGARNDGINLAAPAGTPVRAAEGGTVIYAGNELEGYGNLVLIQHKDDWVSAYAHADALKVARGDKVERGQTIATVGKTGSVEAPQLHFELRRKSKPVDPLPQLSGA